MEGIAILCLFEEEGIYVCFKRPSTKNELAHKVLFDIYQGEIVFARSNDKRKISNVKLRVWLYAVLMQILLLLLQVSFGIPVVYEQKAAWLNGCDHLVRCIFENRFNHLVPNKNGILTRVILFQFSIWTESGPHYPASVKVSVYKWSVVF